MRYDDEDYIAEMKQQAYEERKMWRNLSCTDGYCGADDCPKCRQGSYRFATGEDDMNEKQEQPAVKIEINCICGRVLEAATYIDNGLIKLVVPVCRCAEGRAA